MLYVFPVRKKVTEKVWGTWGVGVLHGVRLLLQLLFHQSFLEEEKAGETWMSQTVGNTMQSEKAMGQQERGCVGRKILRQWGFVVV